MLPSGVREYFWLIAAGLMLANAALLHTRAGALVRAGQATDHERRRFAVGVAWVSVGFCLLAQAVVWLTGESRPECLAALPPNSPASVATTALTLVGWTALLLRVWRGQGAQTLARFAPAFMPAGSSDRTYSPAGVRRLVSGVVVIAMLGSVVASRVAPPPADCEGTAVNS
ncbi:MAG: hypothetical protein ACREOF_15540 [Gemmatimonadales bacterium]